MRRPASAGFSLIEAVIALLIATMTLSFIGTAGYSLRFAMERATTTVDSPEDRLALRRILTQLVHGAVALSGDARRAVLLAGGTRWTLRIEESGDGWRLVARRDPAESYPLPSLLLESDTPLSFGYSRRTGEEGESWESTYGDGTTAIAVIAEPSRTPIATARIPRVVDPDCLLRVGPREVERCQS